MYLTQQQRDAACLAHVFSVDMLVVPPAWWILSGRFAVHKTAGYLPVLCLFLIYSADWQIAHYSHAYAALSAVMVSVFSVAGEH